MRAVAAALGVGAFAALALSCGKHRRAPPQPTTFAVTVTEQGKPVGARVLLIGSAGPLHMGSLDLYDQRQGAGACALAPGVVGSWDGLALAYGSAEVPVKQDRCAIPPGRYRVWAWRGVEYERWEGEVDLSENRGRVALAIPLERAWRPDGTLAADLHVHARASDDSLMPNPQRVTAQVAAGIQVIGLSDHNTNGDLDDEIHELGLDAVVASIASNEVTSETVHLGVYPVQVDRSRPHGGAPYGPEVIRARSAQLLAIARAFPGHPILQVNHPRFRVTALYDVTRWDGVRWPPPFSTDFDAVEVLAGFTAFDVPADRRFDEGVRDFYTFIDHGHLIAPLGNSDTHDLNWVLDGTTRNYVFVPDPRTQPFDEDAFVAAIRARRVVATSGPWLDVEVASRENATPTAGPGQHVRADGGAVWVDVTVAQARWVKVDRIRVTIGGAHGPEVAQTIDVPAGVRTYRWRGRVAVGAADTWVGITAEGDTALPLELTGTYQRDRWQHPGVTPFAIASPILVDGDGDGHWKRGDADVTLR